MDLLPSKALRRFSFYPFDLSRLFWDHTYKAFGGSPITVVPQDRTDSMSQQQARMIAAVIDAYKDYSALQLSNITHQPGTPWYETYHTWGDGCIIPNELIQDFYRRRARGE